MVFLARATVEHNKKQLVIFFSSSQLIHQNGDLFGSPHRDGRAMAKGDDWLQSCCYEEDHLKESSFRTW